MCAMFSHTVVLPNMSVITPDKHELFDQVRTIGSPWLFIGAELEPAAAAASLCKAPLAARGHFALCVGLRSVICAVAMCTAGMDILLC